MKSEFGWEWDFQERRYNRAKKKADKYIALAKTYSALTDAWVKVMQDATEKQKQIEVEKWEEKEHG